MTLQQFGLKGYAEAIEENLALAAYLAQRVREAPDLALMAPPRLSIVCFRFVGDAASGAGLQARGEDAIAALNRSLLERLQLGGEAFLTSTELRGQFVLRACFVNYRSRREDVDRMLDAVRTLGHQITLSTD